MRAASIASRFAPLRGKNAPLVAALALWLVTLTVFAVGCGGGTTPTEKPIRREQAKGQPDAEPKPEDKKPSEKSGDGAAEKKSRYDVPTAGELNITKPADLWGLPGQNRAVLKDRFFEKR